MVKKLIWPGIFLIATAIIALFIYLAFQSIFKGVLVYLIAFITTLHIICASFYLVEDESVTWKIMKLFCGWYVGCLSVFKSGDGGAIAGLLIFIIPVTYGAGVCFVFSLIIALIISPIAFLIYSLKK